MRYLYPDLQLDQLMSHRTSVLVIMAVWKVDLDAVVIIR